METPPQPPSKEQSLVEIQKSPELAALARRAVIQMIMGGPIISEEFPQSRRTTL